MKRPQVNFEPEAWVSIKDLKPHPKNPRADLREHPSRFKSLMKSIKEGVFEPIKVSKLSGYCLAGHQRLSAFVELGFDEVPVMYNDCKSEKEEIEVMLKDNNEWGFYQFDDVADLIDEYDLNVPDLGFDAMELGELTALIEEPPGDDELVGESKDKSPKMTITFETFEDMENAKVEIEKLLEKYDGAYYSVSGGEL